MEENGSSGNDRLHQIVAEAECKEEGCKVSARGLCDVAPTCAHPEGSDGVGNKLVRTLKSNENNGKGL